MDGSQKQELVSMQVAQATRDTCICKRKKQKMVILGSISQFSLEEAEHAF